jgi:hypothetical protein
MRSRPKPGSPHHSPGRAVEVAVSGLAYLVVGAPGIERPQALRAAWAFGSFSWLPTPPGIPLGAPPGIPLGAPPGIPLGAPPGIPLGAPAPVGMSDAKEIPAAERHFRIAVMSKPPGLWPAALGAPVAAGVLVGVDDPEDEPQAARLTVATATATRLTAGRRM